MRLPYGWSAERTPGYGEVHYLIHECGWRSAMAYDLICNEAQVRPVVYNHVCDGGIVEEMVDVIEVVEVVEEIVFDDYSSDPYYAGGYDDTSYGW